MIPMAFEASVGTKNKVDRVFEIYFLEEAESAVTKPEMILRFKYCMASLVPGSQMSAFIINSGSLCSNMPWISCAVGQSKEIRRSFPCLCFVSLQLLIFMKAVTSRWSVAYHLVHRPTLLSGFCHHDRGAPRAPPCVVRCPVPPRLLLPNLCGVSVFPSELSRIPPTVSVDVCNASSSTHSMIFCFHETSSMDALYNYFFILISFYFKIQLSFLILSRKTTEKTSYNEFGFFLEGLLI